MDSLTPPPDLFDPVPFHPSPDEIDAARSLFLLGCSVTGVPVLCDLLGFGKTSSSLAAARLGWNPDRTRAVLLSLAFAGLCSRKVEPSGREVFEIATMGLRVLAAARLVIEGV